MLDRVQIMRAFDFAGVVEAIGEIARMWESNDHHIHTPGISELERGRKVIDDSQDEENYSDDNAESKVDNAPGRDSSVNAHDGQVGMVIVDTISNVVNSIISKSQVQGIPRSASKNYFVKAVCRRAIVLTIFRSSPLDKLHAIFASPNLAPPHLHTSHQYSSGTQLF